MARAGSEMTEEGEQTKQSTPSQREPLLRTKLFIPSTRLGLVTRPRLIELLNSGLHKTFILVSAPAGYGKTTLVSGWLTKSGFSSTWLSLDEDDNDETRFLRYFVAALQKIIPASRSDLTSALGAGQAASYEAPLKNLINEIAECAQPFVFVLDDFQVIHARPVLDMLASLLEHMPPQMHLLLVSRTDPPLPLFRLRARRQLVEIRQDQLRFTREETAVFLNEVEGLTLSLDDIAAMEARTEGWIAGLQLAALSLQGCEDVHGFIAAFAGSHHYIIDYLTEEVLKRQPERVRSFLLQTSILRRMCGPLCEAVVEFGTTQRVDGQSMLEDLERMNLFLIPLDDERRWYRYHHLFADMLNRRLEHVFPRQPPELHRRASQWHEQNGLIPEAIYHALQAGDLERATGLIEQNGALLLIRGEVTTLLKWIEAVEPYSQEHPWLYIFKAWAFALSGHLDRVDGMLTAAERLITSLELTQSVRMMQGTIAAARAHRANLQGEARLAANYARQALEYLPDIDLVSRSLRTVATSLLGDASAMSGDLEEAKQAYVESARIGQAAGDIHLTIVVNSNLANILVEQGLIREAARVYSETLQMATRPDGQKMLIAGRLCIELSQVSYEFNYLEDAFRYAQQGLALCRQWGNMDLEAVGYVMLARLERLQGHPEKAHEAMQRAEELAKEFDLAPRYSTWVTSALARLSILQGNLAKASHLIQENGILLQSEDEIAYVREPLHLAQVRLLLAQGEYDEALAQTRRLLERAEAANRTGRVIEVLALQALAFRGKKDIDQALALLERAFSLAQLEGYTRLFLDEGEPMARLLYQARAHSLGGGYASELLSALGKVPATQPQPAHQLIEPLTRRELELLRLIQAGCTNQEIADRLVLSIPTVKRHISNIYAKLGAKSRTQAVSLARELGLFE